MQGSSSVVQRVVLSDADEGIRYHSFSSISQYSTICSLQFYFQRILRLPKDVSVAE